MNEISENKEDAPTELAGLYAGYYRRAYNTLLAQANPKTREKVLQSRMSERMQRDPDVCKFVQDVINLAEH